MQILIYGMIIAGAMLMVMNVINFIFFSRSTRDVISGSRARDKRLTHLALMLISFFLVGYILVAIFGKPDILMAMILFGGSIFVTIVNYLMWNLLNTAKERSIDVAEVIIGAIDARDPNLNGHSRHVQNVTMTLYRYIPPQMKADIDAVSLSYASLMHDVGKLGIPEAILNKPDKLTDEEWAIMRRHPKIGVEVLKPLHSFGKVMPWIEYHHERIDGKGYYKIPGDKIPFAAKIIAVADTYSAITMRRSYKAPRTHEDAIHIIKEAAGTQLDDQLVAIFCNIPREELIACAPPKIEVTGPENRT